MPDLRVRVTTTVGPRLMDSLEYVRDITEENDSEIMRKGLRLYEWMLKNKESESQIFVKVGDEYRLVEFLI